MKSNITPVELCPKCGYPWVELTETIAIFEDAHNSEVIYTGKCHQCGKWVEKIEKLVLTRKGKY